MGARSGWPETYRQKPKARRATREQVAMAQQSIPCLVFRGGTSKGPFFDAAHLPSERASRDKVILAAMGSPDARQIDGIGGADSLTSKVAIVSASKRAGIDVDYLFAQVSPDRDVVDTAPTCGNMLSGVAPFAIETGLVQAQEDETRVMVYNVNTGSRIEAVVKSPGGRVDYDGDTAIDGVPGRAAPVYLNFMDVVGAKTGKLLPTGSVTESIDGIEVTCIDVAMPMVLLRASDLGLSGYETRAEIDRNRLLFELVEPVRQEAGRRMGLGDVSAQVVPKVGLLAPPRAGGDLCSRYFTPWQVHAAHAVTGAVCVGTAAQIGGSIAHQLCRQGPPGERSLSIEHPSGQITVRLETSGHGPSLDVVRAGVVRTARLLMRGEVYVPSRCY